MRVTVADLIIFFKSSKFTTYRPWWFHYMFHFTFCQRWRSCFWKTLYPLSEMLFVTRCMASLFSTASECFNLTPIIPSKRIIIKLSLPVAPTWIIQWQNPQGADLFGGSVDLHTVIITCKSITMTLKRWLAYFLALMGRLNVRKRMLGFKVNKRYRLVYMIYRNLKCNLGYY